jgi:di/tricarboxylate transporter
MSESQLWAALSLTQVAPAWLITLVVLLLLLAGLVRDLPADALFLGALVLLAVTGVLTPKDAFAGFANSAVLMVAALFVVAAALGETGVMDYFVDRVFGRIRSETVALLVLAAILVPASAFLNNTPIVAMMVPVVITWCRRREISPSRLLMPVSFLTILGGCCTLIGTSTNLVVQGLMKDNGLQPFGLLDLGTVGLPCAIVGTLYLLTVGRRLLPDRKELIEQLGEARREYLVEMLVQPSCRLVGRAVADAGLRQLPGLFLIEVDRDGEIIAPVEPTVVLRTGDRLVFTGVVGTILDLEKIPGLVPAADATYELAPQLRRGRQLCEAVISPTSPLVGQTVRDADFRALYNAAVVAVHRNGARLTNKIGDVELRPGDTLLLQVGPHFSRAFRNSPDFYLVSDVEDSRPLRREKAWIAVAIFAALVAALVTEVVDPTVAAFVAAGLMVLTRCISINEARRSVDWSTLVAIAASFGVGLALERSGLAKLVAAALADATRPYGPVAALAALYFATMVLNELVSNNASAALAFPFCLRAAEELGVSDRPFMIGVALAASLAFASPIGYQCHMMVYGPGGYRFRDFVRVGVPLNLLCWIVAIVLIPIVWPFTPVAPSP